jgi:hypothetical protein
MRFSPPLGDRQASRRLGPDFTQDAISAGAESLENLLPGFEINLELLKAADWVGGLLAAQLEAVCRQWGPDSVLKLQASDSLTQPNTAPPSLGFSRAPCDMLAPPHHHP